MSVAYQTCGTLGRNAPWKVRPRLGRGSGYVLCALPLFVLAIVLVGLSIIAAAVVDLTDAGEWNRPQIMS